MNFNLPVPRNILIAAGVVVVLAAVLLFTGGEPKDAEDGDASPSVSASTSPAAAKPKPKATATPGTAETTAATGSYACAGGKKFTLSVRTDGTARVTGSDFSDKAVLRKNSIGIWISDDQRTAVRETAGYTILLENYATTRDLCYKK